MVIGCTRKSLAFMIIRLVEQCGNFARYSLRHVFSVSKLYQKTPDRSVCQNRAIRIRAAGLAGLADDSSLCSKRSCSSVYLVIRLPTLRVSHAGRFGLSTVAAGGDIPCVPA